MKRLITIELEGDEEADLEQALEEAVRLINDGCREGTNQNETGSFAFTVNFQD